MKIAYKYIILYCLTSMSSGYLYWFPKSWKTRIKNMNRYEHIYLINNTNSSKL